MVLNSSQEFLKFSVILSGSQWFSGFLSGSQEFSVVLERLSGVLCGSHGFSVVFRGS